MPRSRKDRRNLSQLASMLAVATAFAPVIATADVYKCPTASGGVTYTDRPCAADAEPLKFRSTSFGGSSTSGEISVTGTSCTGASSFVTASGMIGNNTNEPKTVRVEATFLRASTVVDTITLPYDVEPFGRTPFSITGGRGGDRCEYSWSWN